MPSSMGHHEHTGLMSATLSRGLTENLEMGSGILDREGPRVPTGPSPGLAGAPGVGVPLSCQRDLCHSLPGSLGGRVLLWVKGPLRRYRDFPGSLPSTYHHQARTKPLCAPCKSCRDLGTPALASPLSEDPLPFSTPPWSPAQARQSPPVVEAQSSSCKVTH